MLTGEHRTYQPARGKWGALELSLRLSAVNLKDKNIAGGRELNITVGLNWYLKRKLRLMVNYIHADLKDLYQSSIGCILINLDSNMSFGIVILLKSRLISVVG